MKQSLFIYLFILTIISVGCQKETIETSTNVLFVEKHYPSPEEEIAKEKVKDFLSFLNQDNNATLRTDFADTEVNEAKWLLEGSANYLKNENLEGRATSHIGSFDVSIENIVVNSELRMKGAEMTTKFADLLNVIEAEEIATGTKAVAVDIILDLVTNNNTNLNVKVGFGSPIGTSSTISWSAARAEVTSGVFQQLQNPGNCYWTPAITIFQLVGIDDGPRCSTMDPSTCLSSLVTPFGGNNYDPDWIPGDIATTILIGNEFIEELSPSTGSGSSSSTTNMSLIGAVVSTKHKNITNGGTVTGREDYLHITSLFGAIEFYCY